MPAASVASELPGLAEGTTTRDDLVFRFGPPAAQFEAGRIATWRLGYGRTGIAPIAGPEPGPHVRVEDQWGAGGYSLVVVFDSRDIAQRLSLIAIRGPKYALVNKPTPPSPRRPTSSTD